MAMTQTSVAAFFQTTRNFYKYVVSSERKLERVAPFQIPLDYSPNSGKRIGILIEQESTNHFPDSEGMVTGVQKSSNVAVRVKSIAGSPKAAVFPSGYNSASYIGSNVNIQSEYIAVSFYAMQSNLQRPIVGYGSDPRSTFTVFVNDKEVNMGMVVSDVQGPMNDLSYRVRLRIWVPGGNVSNIKIYKTARQSKGMTLSRIQFEPEVWTSYIPTTGTPATRPAETVYRNLTHGIDHNENQGTYDLLFSATPGAKGSPMSLLKSDWSEYVAVAHQSDENGFVEALRFHTSSTHIPVPLRHHDQTLRERYSAVRFCFSGYGVRGVVAGVPDVVKLKAFDSFINGKFNRFHFGASYDGSHFTGHIHLMNAYARTFTDEELLDITFVPNDTSLDPDYDLEESTVFATAAAIFRTDEEALLYQNVVIPPTPQRILAAWPRTSDHYVAMNPDNATGNGKRWYFSPSSYSFVQPANSGQIETILSPIKLSEFSFEATLNSNEWHPDAMGLIAAADIINGQLYSIIIGVDAGGGMTGYRGRNARLGMFLYSPSTPNGWGNFGVQLAGNNFLPKHGWTSKLKMKIVRQGTFLSVVVSKWNGADYDYDSELVYNLANLPGVAQQLGLQPARYGFMSHSTPGSRYLNYELTSSQAIDELKIYSQESNSYWKFDNGAWTLQEASATDDILPATRINNKVTKESYVIDEDTLAIEFQRNAGIPYGEATITVPKNKVTDLAMSTLIDQFEFEEQLYFFNVYNESGVIAEQIDIKGEIKLRIVTEGTNGTFVALIGTEPQTDAFGITEETIAFRKVNVVVT